MSRATTQIWTINQHGDINDAGDSVHRTVVELLLPLPTDQAVTYGLGPVRWPRRVTMRILKRLPINDLLWNTGSSMVISDRFKQVLERVVPRQAEFFPVHRVKSQNGRVVSDMKYWVVNWLKVHDCIDHDGSMITLGSGQSTMRIRGLDVIAPSKIPTGCRIFRAKDVESMVLVTRTARNAIVKAGIPRAVFEKARVASR